MHQLSLPVVEKDVSKRWHMHGEDGRIFILYGEYEEVRAIADRLGYTHMQESGFYTKKTNQIIGAQDGSVVLVDWVYRPSHT